MLRSNRRKLREITITYGRNIQEGKHGHPQKKSSTGKKKCWKQIVTLVPCSMVNNVNNEKNGKDLAPARAQWRTAGESCAGMELLSRVVLASKGHILIWGPNALGLDPGRLSVVLETWGAPRACSPAPCTSRVHSRVPLRVDASFLQLLDRHVGFLLFFFFFANYRETEHLHLLHRLQVGQ